MRKPLIRSNINPLALPHFFFAGNSVLTFRNNEAGTHMTIKVKQARDKKDRKIKLPIFFVHARLLGDGESGYVYTATIFKETMSVKLAKGVEPGTKLHEVLKFIMTSLKNPASLKEKNVSLLHEGRCLRCHMCLTQPESINIGFGPDCLEHILATNKNLTEDFFKISV